MKYAGLLKIIIIKLVALGVLLASLMWQFSLMFCGMRGPWARDVVDGCTIYGYVFPCLTFLTLASGLVVILVKETKNIAIAALIPFVLTLLMLFMVATWQAKMYN